MARDEKKQQIISSKTWTWQKCFDVFNTPYLVCWRISSKNQTNRCEILIGYLHAMRRSWGRKTEIQKPNTETTLITQPFYLFLHYIRVSYRIQAIAPVAQNFSGIHLFDCLFLHQNLICSNSHRMPFVILEWGHTHAHTNANREEEITCVCYFHLIRSRQD